MPDFTQTYSRNNDDLNGVDATNNSEYETAKLTVTLSANTDDCKSIARTTTPTRTDTPSSTDTPADLSRPLGFTEEDRLPGGGGCTVLSVNGSPEERRSLRLNQLADSSEAGAPPSPGAN